ncbi:unnamed protein product [Ilex paraguariensis]|uniref:Uncharacterized protein n=1 Tax=Ilex paraguariensis TaxID=185542 RepID=A0ABC8U5M7_9AQUA
MIVLASIFYGLSAKTTNEPDQNGYYQNRKINMRRHRLCSASSFVASFIRKTILKFIVEDSHFLVCLEKAIKTAFVKANRAFANDSSLDISSGTTTLTALIFGR